MWNFSGQLRSNFEPTNNNSIRFFPRSSNSACNLPISNSRFPNLIPSRASILTPPHTKPVSSPYFRQSLAPFTELSGHPSLTTLSVSASRGSSGTDKNGNTNFSASMLSILSTISTLPNYIYQFSKQLILFEVFGVLYPGTLEIKSELQTRVASFVIIDLPQMRRQWIQLEQPGSVKCIFHDNDDLLQEFIEGHIYRCVGHFSLDKGILKCLRVREASQAEIDSLPTTIARMQQKLPALH